MAIQLTDLMSSKAKGEVLRALAFQRAPVTLRALSFMTGLHVHSVETALSALESEGIVSKIRKGRNVFLSMDEKHPAAAFIEEVFQKEALLKIAEDSKRNAQQARGLLKFISRSNAMLERARQNKVKRGSRDAI